MPLEILTIPCLSDNYAFILHNTATGETAVVDVPEATPILAVLASKGWGLDYILITHHHGDHIDGVDEVKSSTGAKTVGAAADARRLPMLDQQVSGGGTLSLLGEDCHIFDVSGHTIGHIAFHFPGSKAVFTADSLMALGCGRLFEGTAAMMWASLSKLAALPADTLVCSGHEYTASNAKFALSIEPDNTDLIARAREISAVRARGEATVPSLLELELATNPFLRAHLPVVKEAVGMLSASDEDVFAEIRARKDRF